MLQLTFELDVDIKGDPGRTTEGLPSARGGGGGIAKESAVKDSARGEDEGKSLVLSRGELSRPTNKEMKDVSILVSEHKRTCSRSHIEGRSLSVPSGSIWRLRLELALRLDP